MPIKPFIYTLLFIGCMGQAFAQEKSLSVENILDIVRKYHPVIKQSFLQNEMAKNELRASRGIFDPSIQINTDEKTYDNKLYYKYNTSELKIPLWYGIDIKAGTENNIGERIDPTLTRNKSAFVGVSMDPFRGIIAYFKVVNGEIRKGDKVKFVATGKEYYAEEIGTLKLNQEPKDVIKTGDVGYIISGIKEAREVKVGDTITNVERPSTEAIQGFEEVKPMVFAGIYPVDTDDYEELRESMHKLQLNDASLVFEPESSAALGFGFRCGFLGMLHMEIIQERLEREFNMTVITTVPNVSYKAYTTKGDELQVHNPSDLPDPSKLEYVEEPFIKANIITKAEFVGPVMSLCIQKRGIIVNQSYLTSDRVELVFEMPMGEIVFDFYDRLKTISKGYASFDYHQTGYRKSDLVRLDMLLNEEPVDALSSLIHRSNAYEFGKKICEKLKELIPRQQFEIKIQASIGAKVIARETISALRKDVTAKCYGGDISRKRKLLEKQKKGKKRMRQVGNVEIPQSAFMAVLKLD